MTLIEEFLSGLKAVAKKPNIHGYRPYEGVQLNFHKCQKRGRILLGGNRVGKTVSGATECVWYLTGTHPYRQTPEPPVYGRGVAVDIEQGLGKIMLPEIQRWLPTSYLLNGSWSDSYSGSSRTLTLNNGSKMDFLTYEQDAEKHAGTSRNFCWWDEEPPEHIFNEDMLRLVDTNGSWWISMTPVLGYTWIHRKYYRPLVEQQQEDPAIQIFLGSTENNPHISPDVLDEITKGMSAEEKEARKHGKFMAASGLVYPSFGQHNIVPPINPQAVFQPIYVGMDHGLRHPTVWLWAYVDNEGRIIVFHEYYESERTVAQHADAIKKWESWARLDDRIAYRIGDPSIEQRSAATGTSVRTLYSENDLFVGLGNNDLRAGLNKVRSYLENFGLFITQDCHNLIDELNQYRWETYATRKANDTKKPQDQPKKTHDDACDALRYLVMSRPDDEFEGWAGEVRANWRSMIQASKTAPEDHPSGDYSYNELQEFGDEGVHTILGEDW
jgi:phage terminase large subunit-like protein